MRAGLVLAAMLRESRGSRGRLLFFTLCLSVGVAAVVGVRGLVSAVEAGIRAQSGKLLGADLAVESRRPLPGELQRALEGIEGVRRTDTVEFATMASLGPPQDPQAPGARPRSRLVELKAVEGTFPFYGELLLDPALPLEELLGPDKAVIAPDLARELALARGDRLWIGGEPFEVAGTVLDEPDRLDFMFSLGPRVLVSGEGLARTSLLSTGSRVRYKALLRLPGAPSSAELRGVQAGLRERLTADESVRVLTREEAQPAVRRSMEQVGRFLGLVALLSLVLGGTGVAQIVRAWIAQRTAAVAVLRCIGFRPREVVWMYASHVVLLAAAGSLLGALAGSAIPWLVPFLAPDLLPRELVQAWQPLAILQGLGLGIAIALVFSLPQLLAVWRISPARVLRSEAEPLPVPRPLRLAAFAVLVLGLFGATWLQARDLTLAAGFSGGMLLLALVLFGGARLIVRGARALPRGRLDPYLRTAVAALGRPGAGTTGAIVALGLGVLVVASMWMVQRRLASELDSALPPQAPTVFLTDVQPDQWPEVERALRDHQGEHVRAVPVVMARISHLDGVPVERIASGRGEGRRSRWVLTREQRITWMESLPADNVITAGALWSRPDAGELSLEEGFARDLGASVGTRVTFDVQGVPVEVVVTSLRSVEWQSFGINFFLVAEPGVLDEAPHFLLAGARVPAASEAGLQDTLAATHANITLLRVRPLLEKLLALFQRLAFAVRTLGLFTILTGLAILAGVASASSLHRAREAALLKTLGVTRRGVATLLICEYSLLGLVAGAVGGGGALALTWVFLDSVVQLPPRLPLLALPITMVAAALLAALAGLAASTRALAARPLASLG